MGRTLTRPPLIAHVIVNLAVGGLENGLVNLINNVPPSRFRHAVICLKSHTRFRERIERDEVQVIALGKREGKDLWNYARLWRVFRSLRPDLVHTRNIGTIDAVFPARLAGVRSIVHGEHGWDIYDATGTSQKYRRLRRLCRPLISRQIAVSEHIAQWLRDTVGVPEHCITQIYNGVDTERFRPEAAARSGPVAARFPAPDWFVVGTVGRMAAIKDPVTLARAFRLLCEDAGQPRRRLALVMVGDGPLREDVSHVLAGSPAEQLTWLAGDRDDVDAILRGLDLFVLPSKNEGISNTILEAMASALPVIATDVGGNPELVLPGTTGVLVPAENPRAMADAIRSYAADPATAVAHGAAARRRVLERFSLESMVDRYVATYDAVLAANGMTAQV